MKFVNEAEKSLMNDLPYLQISHSGSELTFSFKVVHTIWKLDGDSSNIEIGSSMIMRYWWKEIHEAK